MKIRKVFYLNEDAKKKRLNFCQKILEMEFEGKKLEGKNIFFTDETKMDTAPNTSGESIRVFSKIKRASKLQKKFINEIYQMDSNKTTREMPGGLIAIKINEKLKRQNIRDKNGKLLSITKSQVNRILKKKYGKPLKIRKVFYLNEEAKKRD